MGDFASLGAKHRLHFASLTSEASDFIQIVLFRCDKVIVSSHEKGDHPENRNSQAPPFIDFFRTL